MQLTSLLVVFFCLWLCSALIPLKKQELDGKYQIGTIQDLFFGIKDKILFRSDDDLFGFLSQKDGELMTVYQLEGKERIVQLLHGMEVVIANGKKLNIFWPFQNSYVRSYETAFLDKYPDFNNIEDFRRTKEGALILTDKYLMRVPIAARDVKITDIKEEILFTLQDSSEVFFNIIDFFDPQTRRFDAYVTSLLTKDKSRQVCFRIASEKDAKAKCIDLQDGEKVTDIVPAVNFNYIELQSGAIVVKNTLEVVQRLTSKPVQYFSGLVTIDDHKLYTPFTKSTHDSRIIVEDRRNGRILTLQVEDKSMTVQKLKLGEKVTFETLITIPKDPKQEPRKVWGFTEKEGGAFKLYVEFEGGLLTCYKIDNDNKRFQEMWKVTTIQAEKVATGKIEAEDLQKKDAAEAEKEKEDADINENENIAADKAAP